MAFVDIEVARTALIVGLVLTAFLYQRTRILSGGAVTGSYLALMLMGGYWETIAGWAVLSLIGYWAITLTAHYFPVPRSWLFAVGVAVPTLIHVIGIQLAGLPELDNYSTYLAAGLYITNGLTAYDAKRQGIPKTLLGVAMVTAVTLAVILPVDWAMDRFSSTTRVMSDISLDNPILILICVITALAVRLGLRWGTAGIIGSLFLLELLSVASIAIILAFTLIGTFIYRWVADYLNLTPRERLYSLLAVGGIVSWFGLFWASWLGIPGAEQAEMYGVEPLLVIGLMMGETQRFGITRMLAGTTLVTAVTWGANYLLVNNPGGVWWVLLVSLVPAAILMVLASRTLTKDWRGAVAAGDRWGTRMPPKDLAEDHEKAL